MAAFGRGGWGWRAEKFSLPLNFSRSLGARSDWEKRGEVWNVGGNRLTRVFPEEQSSPFCVPSFPVSQLAQQPTDLFGLPSAAEGLCGVGHVREGEGVVSGDQDRPSVTNATGLAQLD